MMSASVSADRDHSDHEASGPLIETGRLALARPVRPREAPRRVDRKRLIVDLGTLALGLGLATLGPSASVGLGWLIGFGVTTIAALAVAGSYAFRLGRGSFEEIRPTIAATATAAMVLMSTALVVDAPIAPGDWVRIWTISTLALLANRFATTQVVARQRLHGEGCARTLVIGAGVVGRHTAERLLAHPEFGLRPVGFLDKDPMPIDGRDMPIPVLGASWDIEDAVAAHEIECVVLTFSNAPHDVMLRLIDTCELLGIRVVVVPRLFERVPSRLSVSHSGGLPLIEMYPTSPHSISYAIKYAIDRIVAALLLLLLAPVLVAVTCTVLLSLGRPVLFRQRRVGMDGREFEMLKFRTMRPPVEGDTSTLDIDADTAPGGVEGVDRRTGVGAFLRTFALDELAQLLNVLKGEMSIVGPRPERPEFVGFFGDHVHRYDARHRVKSGITGWAQVHRLRGKTSIADRVEWDNYYIENFSLWLDLKILLLTIPEIFRGKAE